MSLKSIFKVIGSLYLRGKLASFFKNKLKKNIFETVKANFFFAFMLLFMFFSLVMMFVLGLVLGLYLITANFIFESYETNVALLITSVSLVTIGLLTFLSIFFISRKNVATKKEKKLDEVEIKSSIVKPFLNQLRSERKKSES